MSAFDRILDNNRRWAAAQLAQDPEYFTRRAKKQEPHCLVIGCSDSRVPAEVLMGVEPGEIFIHRNVANQVFPSDLNVLSVLHYAVEVLDVAHVIVVGHYGCGGVAAAMGHGSNGVVDHWLGNIRNVIRWNQRELDAIADPEERTARLVELNVIEQVHHLSRTPIIRDAWVRGRRPTLHGLVYGMTDGLLRTLVTGVDGAKDAQALLDEPPLPDVVSDAPPDGAGSAGGPVVRRQPAMVGPEA